jgi:hypothetical protein
MLADQSITSVAKLHPTDDPWFLHPSEAAALFGEFQARLNGSSTSLETKSCLTYLVPT